MSAQDRDREEQVAREHGAWLGTLLATGVPPDPLTEPADGQPAFEDEEGD